MAVIIVTVVVQGFLVPKEERGTITKQHLFINDGIFQAIGVISFGKNRRQFLSFFLLSH